MSEIWKDDKNIAYVFRTARDRRCKESRDAKTFLRYFLRSGGKMLVYEHSLYRTYPLPHFVMELRRSFDYSRVCNMRCNVQDCIKEIHKWRTEHEMLHNREMLKESIKDMINNDEAYWRTRLTRLEMRLGSEGDRKVVSSLLKSAGRPAKDSRRQLRALGFVA